MVEMDTKGFDTVEEVEMEDTLEGKFLTFTLGNEEYGIEIRNVT